MADPKLEEVFKTSGMPTFTFVKPAEYDRLIVGLRTPGRGLVVEGPSGIGKTTSVLKALEELGIVKDTLMLSARKADDRAMIAELPLMKNIGTVLVDDFHRLEEGVKHAVADFLKTLADEETQGSKLIVVGINNAGDSLVRFATDLNNRIDTLRFETNSDEMVEELVAKGEGALDITINSRTALIGDAHGSFHIAQMLCHEMCLSAGILERCEPHRVIESSLEVVREHVLDELGRAFYEKARKLATGPRLRREGRAPYLHMLRWLAESEDWSLQLDQALAQHRDHRASVGQIIDKGYFNDYLTANPDLQDVIHYDSSTRMLVIEDPKFLYFLRNLIWNKFARQVGFLSTEFEGRYDFALSFAGADRGIAEAFYNRLIENEVAVFYDQNEQHRILAANVEDYLAPIYRSEAQYVIALLGAEYPRRIWTKFESEQFKQRFGEGSVIPIWFADVPMGIFDETARVGGMTFDRSIDLDTQIGNFTVLELKKLAEDRAAGASVVIHGDA
ncbi:MAG TPA: hypothetical protein VK578_03210 [Edaphobacter sp.]|nr:hypothetical protein [Edaphobacter sp.]